MTNLQQALSAEEFILLDLHQDNIFPDLADTFPGDHVLIFSSQKAEKSSRTGNDQSSDASCDTVEFHIGRAAQAAAGTGIDNFFLFQLAQSHGKTCFSL